MNKSDILSIVVILSVIVIFWLIIIIGYEKQSAYEKKHPCIEWKNEEYYDSTGTSLWVATKNPGLLALNGYKTRRVCVIRK